MDDNYWTNFWIEHGKISKESHQQQQVLRTFNKKVIDDQRWDKTLMEIFNILKVKRNNDILEVFSGNGLITQALSPICQSITAVDVSEDLLKKLVKYENVTTMQCDVRSLDFNEIFFDKIIVYAGLQYLNYKEVIHFLQKAKKWTKPGGNIYIGDIPDIDKIWEFYNSTEREAAYFESITSGKPIIGTWFNKLYLQKLAKFCGFKHAEIIEQKKFMIYSHFRFDMLLTNY
jgi:cyclopropane fatty-acyl-phospholipid synthase-like methyltransferase